MDLNVANSRREVLLEQSLRGGYMVCPAHKMNKANLYYRLQEKEKASDIPEVPN